MYTGMLKISFQIEPCQYGLTYDMNPAERETQLIGLGALAHLPGCSSVHPIPEMEWVDESNRLFHKKTYAYILHVQDTLMP